MKANNGSGNIPERDLWETEQNFWNHLNAQYHFTFDACADENNAKVYQFSNDFESVTKEQLETGIVWMNPPFSKAREMFIHFFKVVHKGVAIYRFDNPETRIWQEIIFPEVTWVFVPKGRISYTPFDIDMRNGMGTRFPSVLIGLNVPPPTMREGVLLIVEKGDES